MSYIQELTDCVTEINENEVYSKDLDLFFLSNIGKELALIADEMHEINTATKAKARYDLGLISREEMLKIFAGGEKT